MPLVVGVFWCNEMSTILWIRLRVVVIEYSLLLLFGGEYWISNATIDWEHAWWWTSAEVRNDRRVMLQSRSPCLYLQWLDSELAWWVPWARTKYRRMLGFYLISYKLTLTYGRTNERILFPRAKKGWRLTWLPIEENWSAAKIINQERRLLIQCDKGWAKFLILIVENHNKYCNISSKFVFVLLD